jgi:hypothetical protein
LNYAVVFRKVKVLGGDNVDTKSSSVKSSSGKVKTTKQQAIEPESKPNLPVARYSPHAPSLAAAAAKLAIAASFYDKRINYS